MAKCTQPAAPEPLALGPEATPGPAARFEWRGLARARCRVPATAIAGDVEHRWTRDEAQLMRKTRIYPKTAAPLPNGRRSRSYGGNGGRRRTVVTENRRCRRHSELERGEMGSEVLPAHHEDVEVVGEVGGSLTATKSTARAVR